MSRWYTQEQLDFLTDNIKGCSYRDLTDIFNSHFGTKKSIHSVIKYCWNKGLRNGLDTKFKKPNIETQFKKGMTPWNKGKTGLVFGGESTRFEKCSRPWNYMPVGTERVNTDGYVDIKIADPRTWRQKHLLIWEAVNGPVPKGMCIIFADGNKLNVVLDNLLLISRGELAVMNRRGLIANDPEITKTGVIVADVYLKVGERKRGRR